MSDEKRSIIDLMPSLRLRPSPTLNENVEFVSAGILMTFKHVYFFPVVKDRGLVGRFNCEHVVRVLEKVRDGGPWRLVAKRIGDICDREVPQVSSNDSLSSILDSMVKVNFGHCCVVDQGNLTAVVSLRDIVDYLSSLKVKAGITMGEIARPIIGLPATTTMAQFLGTLLTKRIRRVAVEGLEKRLMADDRLVAENAFTNEGLTTLRHTPRMFFERRLSELTLVEPGRMSGEQDVAQAWDKMYSNPAECLIVDDKKILTPWDAVITPYSRGKLPLNST
jgi:CBS domain-containing protein